MAMATMFMQCSTAEEGSILSEVIPSAILMVLYIALASGSCAACSALS